MTEYVFTEDMMRAALRCNGYFEEPNDHWRHRTWENNLSVADLNAAFRDLLHRKNLYSMRVTE